MPFDDPWLRAGKFSPLEFERRLYTQTGNAIHVIRGYQICSEQTRGDDGAITLPDWIGGTLITSRPRSGIFGEQVDEMRPIPDLVSTLAATLDFKQPGRGVRTDAFTDWAETGGMRKLAIRVRCEIRLQPDKSITEIVIDLAEVQQIAPNPPSGGRGRRGTPFSTRSRPDFPTFANVLLSRHRRSGDSDPGPCFL